jgi:hypothetical protein
VSAEREDANGRSGGGWERSEEKIGFRDLRQCLCIFRVCEEARRLVRAMCRIIMAVVRVKVQKQLQKVDVQRGLREENLSMTHCCKGLR